MTKSLSKIELNHFILEGKEIVPTTLEIWAKWFEGNQDKKRVAQTVVGDLWISTVFLGLNHNYGEGPPILFETLVFKRKENNEIDYCEIDGERYCTWEQAQAGHNDMVEKYKDGIPPDEAPPL
jgi:hypothetical protein